MDYFFFRAKGARAVGNHERAEHYYTLRPPLLQHSSTLPMVNLIRGR